MGGTEGSEREKQVFQLLDGDLRVWIEQESIHVVAFDRPYNDPVELTRSMALRLAAELTRMANQLSE